MRIRLSQSRSIVVTAQSVEGVEVKSRRREIIQHLAHCGLRPDSRWQLLPGRSRRRRTEPHVHRVRMALEGLGPVFSAFGLYLSTRADLLPAQQCLELSTIPDQAAVTPPDVVRELIERELGGDLAEAFAAFDAEPFESHLLSQAHRARLRNNQRVIVEVIHPEMAAGCDRDAQLLDLLPESLGRDEWVDVQLKDALVDFRTALERQTDMTYRAEALRSLGGDMGTRDGFATTLVYRDLCTSMVLTRQRLPGRRLSDLLLNPDSDTDGSVDAEAAAYREEVATALSRAWLRQMLEGRPFPVDPLPANTVALPDGRIAFTGSLFTGLSDEVKTNMWNYLVAAAEQNPDRACAALIQEMEPQAESSSEEELRIRFRQIVPFRDGGWDREKDNESLAEYLFLHWRAMRDRGYRPRPDLLGFFRGLFSIADMAHRLAPDRDVLREGLMELRLDQGLARMRQRVVPRQWTDLLMQNASMMMALPYELDQALTRAAQSEARPNNRAGAYGQRQNTRTAMIALLFLAAMALFWGYYPSGLVAVPREWIDRGGAVLCVLLGAGLLRVATRRH